LGEPADDLLGHGRLERARREVVEEEEGAGAADGDVVDAVVDEVLADGVVAADADGHLQLRPDAVDRGDEDGLVVGALVEGEEPAEGADVGEDAGRERLADEALDAADGLLAGLDVYAGVSVRGGHGGRSEGAGKVRVRERRNAGAGGDASLPFSPFLPLTPSLPGRLRLA